jgi:hypothetical protein
MLNADKQGTLASAVVLGILATIIADRIYYNSKLQELKDDLVHTLKIPEKFSGYHIFNKSKDALVYVKANIPRATKVYNTRLEESTSLVNSSQIKSLVDGQDILIAEAVSAGADLEFVYDREREGEIVALRKLFSQAASTKQGGGCVFYKITTAGAPVLQMIILEYGDGSIDALIGWDLGSDKVPDAKVIKFSERPVSEFFIGVFKSYTRLSVAEKID